MTFLELY